MRTMGIASTAVSACSRLIYVCQIRRLRLECTILWGIIVACGCRFFFFSFFRQLPFFLFYLLSERGLFVCFAVFACRLCINCGVREDSPLFPLLRRERWNNKQRDLSHCVTCDLIGFMPTYDARQRGKIAVREHFRSILLQLQPATPRSPSTDPRDLCNVRKSVPNRVCHWLWLCKVFNYVCG